MMLREKSTTSTQAEAAAFDSLIRREYSERALQHVSIFDIGKIGVDAYLSSIIDEPTPVSQPDVAAPVATEKALEPTTTPEAAVEEIIPEVAETETTVSPRTKTMLGRIATAPLRAASWVNKMHYSLVATAIDKLPGGLTKEDVLARDQARQEKYATQEGDGFLTRTRKAFGRNALRAYAWLPTVAMGTLGASSILRPVTGVLHDTIPTVTTAYSPAVATTLIPIDGLGGKDGTAWGNFLQETNQANGATTVKPVQYPAEIFPVGTTTMKDSAAIGTADAYAKYETSKGGNTTIAAYSEGNASGLQTVNKIIDDNGGNLPDTVHVKEFGNPYTRAGVFHNPIAKAIDPILKGVGIVPDLQSPKGADNYYWKNDFWANSGNQSGPTQIRLMGELATGGHEPYNPAEAVKTTSFVDADGVKDHVGEKQYSPLVQKAIEMFHIPDPDSLNAALDKIAPIGINPDVQVQPDYDGGSAALSDAVQKNFGIYIAPDMVNNIAHMLGNIPQQVTGTVPDQVAQIGDPNTIPSNAVVTGPGVTPPTDLPPAPAPAPVDLPPAPAEIPPAPVDPAPIDAPVPAPAEAPADPVINLFPPAPEQELAPAA